MKISTNFDRGRNIKDVKELVTIALAKGSVYHTKQGMRAARVYCNQQLWTLYKDVKAGKFYRTVKRT